VARRRASRSSATAAVARAMASSSDVTPHPAWPAAAAL
jgi:hypothetical protein